METKLLRQIRLLQICVVVLFASTAVLCINIFHPLLQKQGFGSLRLSASISGREMEFSRLRFPTPLDSMNSNVPSVEELPSLD